MSVETFSPVPLNTFGSLVTLLDPSDVPVGTSPNLQDVDFFPGGIRTRPGPEKSPALASCRGSDWFLGRAPERLATRNYP